jgi:adenylosuccinate synthase
VDEAPAAIVSTRALLEERVGSGPRTSLQELGERLDRTFGASWVATPALAKRAEVPSDRVVVLDAVRTAAQVQAIRNSAAVVHVHLTAAESVLKSRFDARRNEAPYEQVRANPTEAAVDGLSAGADLVLDTGALSIAETRKAVLTHLTKPGGGRDGR